MGDLRILAFDTSGPHCAASLVIGGKVKETAFEEMRKGQAERLMPMLEEVLATDGAVWEELDAVAVGIGPGNFTGIRIAVSAARGIALATGIPAIGVSSFEVIRGPLSRKSPERQLISVAGPRNSFYLQAYRDGHPMGEAALLQNTPEDWQALADPPFGTELLGPAAEQLMLRFGNGAVDLFPWSDADIDWRRGVETMAEIAAERLRSGTSIPRPAPLYVRPADAAPASDPPPVILP